ncbi:hypothetical protein B0H14DRAFT_3736157, partial [Mycena olivaceomarginata]
LVFFLLHARARGSSAYSCARRRCTLVVAAASRRTFVAAVALSPLCDHARGSCAHAPATAARLSRRSPLEDPSAHSLHFLSSHDATGGPRQPTWGVCSTVDDL